MFIGINVHAASDYAIVKMLPLTSIVINLIYLLSLNSIIKQDDKKPHVIEILRQNQ